MAKEEPLSTSKDLKELQKKLSLLIESIQNNSKVIALMKSPVGQYLDRHPFMALTVLVFVAMSAIPVGFFLLIVVLTSLAAFVGVILLEGLVISVGGLLLLCVLCGLSFVSLAMSGTIIVSYVVVSSLFNYWFPPRNERCCLYLNLFETRWGQSKLFCLISILSEKPATFGNNGSSDKAGKVNYMAKALLKKSKDMLSTVKCCYSLKYLHLICLYCLEECGLLSHFCKKSYENA
ncbi:lipid droplet assembly factor 1 isoform X1 [Meles meles]|uniref:lipid droplet assembly factor 1 isoform X1 n=1 Tax=Meles meles TaxID=9662 RepID=UPI001E699139|nr:lipid droplet assembly factor 1 isoform X1 [Meles meles]XP_045848481.1 lipid droplet assembly factor 1 isoform X1 [Meles meles]XP_045848482.1 lipid droplet assembly factor 1 isoform X1 [Meles meles]